MPLIAAVTDRTAFTDSIRDKLEPAGFSIVSVSTAVLLQTLPDHGPDLIVLDWSTEPDGFELLHRVRQISDIPVIALTSQYEAIAAARILNAGADDVSPLGARKAVVIARVRAVLRRCARISATESVEATRG